MFSVITCIPLKAFGATRQDVSDLSCRTSVLVRVPGLPGAFERQPY
jgi:hypothetical protein